MSFRMGPLEIGIILVIILIIFGVGKLPQVGDALGKGIRAFRKGQSGEEEEKKSAYDVVLQEVGDQKIAVIKAIRGINQDLGLKEAKDLVESAPKTVAEALPVEEAEKAKKTLEEAGATVELK